MLVVVRCLICTLTAHDKFLNVFHICYSKELSWTVSYHSEDGKFLQQRSTILDSKEDIGKSYWLKGHGPIRIVSQVKVSIQAKLTLHHEKCSHSRFYAG